MLNVCMYAICVAERNLEYSVVWNKCGKSTTAPCTSPAIFLCHRPVGVTFVDLYVFTCIYLFSHSVFHSFYLLFSLSLSLSQFTDSLSLIPILFPLYLSVVPPPSPSLFLSIHLPPILLIYFTDIFSPHPETNLFLATFPTKLFIFIRQCQGYALKLCFSDGLFDVCGTYFIDKLNRLSLE